MYVCYAKSPEKKNRTETGKIFEIYLTMIFDVS